MTARSPSFNDANIAALAPNRDMMIEHLLRLFGNQPEGLVELAWTPVNSNQVTSANLYSLDHLEDPAQQRRAPAQGANRRRRVSWGCMAR